MTKFASANDPGYVGIKNWVYALIKHSKKVASPFIRQPPVSTVYPTARALIQGPLSRRLIPDDYENIHHQVTATAVWNMENLVPSTQFSALSSSPTTTTFSKKRTSISRVSSIDVLEEVIDHSRSLKKQRGPKSTETGVGDREEVSESSQFSEFRVPEEQRRIHTISQWISNVDHQAMHDFSASERYQNSGVWLSRELKFRQWRDSSSSTIFWLHGSSK
jgi:hypothetical protein